ncbi:FtsX-like permease family protein [Fulvivirga sp. RKSG066]|uniref:ABC transporter permease n=1 Tax=Fulvivirga aurantia TaxID=2529383 RepID=UPI0012BCB859|nr:FtsX-like permease family protein [Fulvivirga aurantia]MTI20741.1 FtsX-like permease family protein [Fulvivirga aurantia]
MWKNYLKTSLRTLITQRYYTLNNLIGLTLGFCTALYLFTYVTFERDFDVHIPERENKLRLTIDKYRDGEKITSSAETYVGCGPVLSEKIPEIESYTRTFNMAIRMNSVISYKRNDQEPINLKLKDYYYADSSFLNFFGYDLRSGDAATALNNPGSAVITASLAHKFFGEDDPIGKVLHYQDEDLFDELYTITGVMDDPPTNTHLPFSLLFSYNSFDTRPYPGNYKDSWKARKAYTYLKINPEANLSAIEEKMASILSEQKEQRAGAEEVLSLQPITAIHFNTTLSDEPVPTIDAGILNFLEIVGILIIVIACINYVNLSTTSLLNQTTEVGVRKVLGAAKRQLILQYYIRCTLINVTAMLIAVLLLFLLWPWLNQISGSNMPMAQLTQPLFISTSLSLLLLTIVVSGLVPSVLLASFNPLKAISGKLKSTNGKAYRFALIVAQFAISFCLIMATIIVQKQLHFMQNQQLGFDINQVLVVRVPGVLPKADRSTTISNSYEQFMTNSLKHASIKDASASLTIPGHERAFRTGAKLQGSETTSTLRFNGAGPSFISTYNLEVIAGRNFKENNAYDIDSAIILSVSAAKTMGFNDPQEAIGKVVVVPAFRITAEVVGIVNDYRLASVKSETEPMAFLYFLPSYTNFFSFRLNGNTQAAMEHISSAWAATFPGNPLDYFFLDDFFNQQYKQEKKLTHLFGVFGTLAIVLAAMGLLGLSAFIAQQRTKEIGIRKALGSSSLEIFKLLSSRFVVMVCLSSLLAAPIIYYFSQQWLSQFPLQTSISFALYFIPFIILLIITLLSISYQTIKVARHNPIDSLRYE